MMEIPRVDPATIKAHDGNDLSDYDVQQLLLEAESRLRIPSDSNIIEKSNSTLDRSNNVYSSTSIPELASDCTLTPYVRQESDMAHIQTGHITPKDIATMDQGLRGNEQENSKKGKEKSNTNSNWFNLPKTELTSELKRDLQLLRMRSILDPKRHYKKENRNTQPPTYSQMGTIIEGPTEFFSGRIAKKDRKNTFLEEALAFEKETKRFNSKYRDIQAAKKSGKRSFYKDLQAKRNRKSK